MRISALPKVAAPAAQRRRALGLLAGDKFGDFGKPGDGAPPFAPPFPSHPQLGARVRGGRTGFSAPRAKEVAAFALGEVLTGALVGDFAGALGDVLAAVLAGDFALALGEDFALAGALPALVEAFAAALGEAFAAALFAGLRALRGGVWVCGFLREGEPAAAAIYEGQLVPAILRRVNVGRRSSGRSQP